MKKDILLEMLNLVIHGESFVTASVVEKRGSAPREAGARMIIREDSRIIGTIGGGRLEAEAIWAAAAVFQTRRPTIHSFRLDGQDAALMDMICGGAGEILLDYMDAYSPETRTLLEQTLQALEDRKRGWLITGIGIGPDNPGERQQCLVYPDGTMTGSFNCSQDFFLRLISGPAKLSIHSEVLEDLRVFIEPLHEGGTVYLFGAGHVSQRIAPLAESVGFRTVALDDRPEFANVDRFPNARIMVLESLERPLPELNLDNDSYLVILTRGHLHDRGILEQVLRSPAAYVGMIGSRHKRELLYKSLIEDNAFTRDELAKVHCPIGIDIAAETPEEIAVSVAAELIRVRGEKSHGRA